MISHYILGMPFHVKEISSDIWLKAATHPTLCHSLEFSKECTNLITLCQLNEARLVSRRETHADKWYATYSRNT